MSTKGAFATWMPTAVGLIRHFVVFEEDMAWFAERKGRMQYILTKEGGVQYEYQ